MTQDAPAPSPILREGRNCWRIARADRIGLIVDAADYFVHLRTVMMAARRELLLIGWDFDFEIDMLPGESDDDGIAPDGYPNRLGNFLEAVVDRSPDLQIYMLKWNGALVAAPGRFFPTLALRLFASDRIHFALDGHHPFGACHHEKIVVADDHLAFCGGIDATEDRWDTSEHAPHEPRRVRKDGSPSEPWHDATTAMTGPVARALADLSRRRWKRATGDTIEAPGDVAPLVWPDALPVALEDEDVAIARTEPPYDGAEMIDEIERLYLDGIAAARDRIYLESQYFAAERICGAIEDRLREPDGPEVVVINPEAALSELEDRAMHVLRGRMIARLRRADPSGDRFRIYNPLNAAGEPIYVHAKVFAVDDRLLRVGSSNVDDRSMGFDSECDVAFEAEPGGGAATGEAIAAFRARLLGEHLGVEADAFARTFDEVGSLVGAIDRLNGRDGRGLKPIEQKEEDAVGRFLADTRLFDPRYLPGRSTAAGRGIRPRHLVVAAIIAGAGIVAWHAMGRAARRS